MELHAIAQMSDPQEKIRDFITNLFGYICSNGAFDLDPAEQSLLGEAREHVAVRDQILAEARDMMQPNQFGDVLLHPNEYEDIVDLLSRQR